MAKSIKTVLSPEGTIKLMFTSMVRPIYGNEVTHQMKVVKHLKELYNRNITAKKMDAAAHVLKLIERAEKGDEDVLKRFKFN